MELIALKTFHTVVNEGGVLAASKRLNTVQSNVTTRIRKLEEELGTALFQRKGRGLEVTRAGRVLLDYSDRMLQLERQACAAVRLAGDATGEVRIGSMESFAALRLPDLLNALKNQCGSLQTQIQTDTSEALVNAVLSHHLDAAFVGGPVDHPDLICEPVLEEELMLVSAPNGREDMLILFRDGCEYRARALQWRRERGLLTDSLMEMGTLDGILGCVAAGLGATLMPRQVLENSRYAGQLIGEPVPAHIGQVPTLLIRHREAKPIRPLTRALVELDWGDAQAHVA